MINLFFSFSHRDEALRDELEVHLAMLKRQGLVRVWHDRRIPAGGVIDEEISQNLEEADVILLLLSPHFLASDYCYEKEAARALQRHKSGDAVVIPVILQPCDWLNSPFRSLRATPTDGKPVAKFANPNDAFLEIATDIRAAAVTLGKGGDAREGKTLEVPPRVAPVARSSNLRVKKTFSDRERDTFADEAFAYIQRYFEGSLDELAARHQNLEVRLKRVGDTGFTAAIYVAGEKRAACRVVHAGRSSFGGEITYSASDAESRGINEGLTVDHDDYQLGLKPLGMSMLGGQRDTLLSMQGAAEHLWALLIQPLQ